MLRHLIPIILLAGCSQGTPAYFPPGLEMLEEPTVDCPASGLAIASGSEDEYDWTHGCGVVEAEVQDVFLALQDTKVAVDQRSVVEWERTDDVEPDYEVSFALWNTVEDIITIEFETTWRYGLLEQEEGVDLPTEAAARYQMTVEPSVISVMRGSVRAVDQGDGTTHLEIIDHVKALQGGTDITSLKVQDLYADVVAYTRGEPIPDHR